MINLSDSQSAVVKAEIGRPIQVLASAGTGKTRVLTERVRRILKSTRKDGVIAFTFTNKAAEEMHKRLDDVEDIENRCWIATIHAVAQRILEQYGNTIGLPTDLHIYEREQDRKTVFLQSIINMGLEVDIILDSKDEKDRNKKIQAYMEQISVVKRRLLTEEDINELMSDEGSFWSIFQGYQDALLASGGIDFDDILVYAHKILLEQPWCGDIYRAKYKHICVDEAQDLNRAQYEFIKALCGEQVKSVMMVGDPNQMIYGFNGSSHEYLCTNFLLDFSPEKFVLKENYRSTKAVVHLANKLKPNSQVESDFALAGKGEIVALPAEDDEAVWVCDKIAEILALKVDKEIEGEISLDKIAVIARNRFVFMPLERQLKERNIPYVLNKGDLQAEPSSFFGRVLDLAVRVRLNPKDWIDGRKLCSILKISVPSEWGGESLLKAFASEVVTSDIFFPELQSKLLLAIDGIDLGQPNIPKFYSEFEALIKSFAEQETSDISLRELEGSLQELSAFRNRWTTFKRKGLGESLASFRNANALRQLSNDAESNGVLLSTAHTMKGLEKDIVILIGMCEGVFPDYRAHGEKEIEEERNNAFVAVTRARRWIYITYPQVRKMPWGDTKAQILSRFVREMQNNK